MQSLVPESIGPYRIQRPAIARGGFGVVHDAIARDGQRVAVKVLDRAAVEGRIVRLLKAKNPALERDPETLRIETQKAYDHNVDQFKDEYQWLTRLKHPNIARVVDIGFSGGNYYIASEFIDGAPLAEYVKGWKPADMVPLFIQALAGLDFIHRNGLIHLDVKSGNILVCRKDDRDEVKIIDFGLAMAPDEYEGKIAGTIATMAPEVALGHKGEVDARADLFSMAAVMYHCLTWGVSFPFPRPDSSDMHMIRRAFEREGGLRIRPPSSAHHKPMEFPEHLETIVMRLLAHKPNDRFYPNARSVMNALATHRIDAFMDHVDTLGAYLRPERNAYIGRDADVATVLDGIDDLRQGNMPARPIVCIDGAEGIGKTHFLQVVRDAASESVERIAIHSLSLPCENDAALAIAQGLTRDQGSNEKPLVLLIDNLHEFAGVSYRVAEALLGLVRLIEEKSASPRVYADIEPAMIVFTANREAARPANMPDEIARLLSVAETDPGIACGIELRPFGEDELEAYLAAAPAMRGKRVSGERVGALLARTGGIPREIVDTLMELDGQGVLFDAEGDIVISGASRTAEAGPPASTQERLLAWYRALPQSSRRVSEVLACWCLKPWLMHPRDEDVLTFSGDVAAAQALKALVQSDTVKRDPCDGTLAFANDFMPSVIHEAMGEEARGEVHGAIAVFLKRRRGKDQAAKHSVAFHTAYSGDATAAARSAILLGRRLLYEAGNIAAATGLFRRAEALIPKEHWKLQACNLVLLVEASSYAGKHDEAWKKIEEGLALAGGRSGQWKFKFLSMGIVHLLNQRKFDEAFRLLAEGEKIVDGTRGVVTRIKFMNLEGRYHCEMAMCNAGDLEGHIRRARELFERTGELETRLPAAALRRVNNNGMHLVYKLEGNSEMAAIALKTRIEERECDDFMLANLSRELAEILRLMGRRDEAREYAKRAAALARKKNMGRLFFHALGALANVYHDSDRFEQAIEIDNRRIAASPAFRSAEEYRRMAARIWTHMGHCYKELGAWDKAEVYFEAATGPHSEAYYRMSATQGLGEVCFSRGDMEGMARYFDAAEALLDNLPDDEVSKSHRNRIAHVRSKISEPAR